MQSCHPPAALVPIFVHPCAQEPFNLFVPEGRNIYRIAKISFFTEGISEQISYELRLYDSVDDESLS